MLSNLQLHSTQRITILALRLSFLLIFSSLFPTSHSYPSRTHITIYASCSQEKYQPNTPFKSNLNSFLSSVATSSSEVTYDSFAIGNDTSTGGGVVYVLYQCRGDLHPLDCSKCVGRCVNQIGLVCPYSLGASLQFEGCYVRYEHSGDLLGKLDTGVRYKKCSKGVSSDVEFFRRRDDVLEDLQTANGFRVSSSGLVQGFAQCLGDLSVSDCSTCLVDAVGKMKSLCGSAAAVDVFLGQCYARYWASGYYDERDSHNDDQVGKSVAIIVGVFGGLAVLVVLLSICKKAAG
ncbi:plasmodesmata-located protein 8 [Lathyrus oleraceus]|uniref:Plasmodesmata-located protein 8 n=1 Tax=Pisum sativum TaxID=3888 RepID=A0A9D4Y2H0_PEA|nr:plasmodesmata-located protein 8-like [Pisum sativum]KAI5430624.1 Plasmodesmata-located protein 8 [Pisum sativum]